MTLSPERHERYEHGRRYVYPVVSRRSGGLSVGINLNPNDACNWRCVYCQVPGLKRGKGPPIDLAQLRLELRELLRAVFLGDFLERHVPADLRRLSDVAFSGNGEPTSSPQFVEAVQLAGEVLAEFDPLGTAERLLITNGSLMHLERVQQGLALLGARTSARSGRGAVWFKLDSATEAGQRAINDVAPGPERVRAQLEICARLCPTWIQTCAFARAGQPPSELEQQALVEFLEECRRRDVPLRGLLLYGLARPSHQPEAGELERLPAEWLQAYGARLAGTGLEVRVFP